MKVFLSAKIRKQEFGRRVSAEDLAFIARTARIALAVTIPAKRLPPGTRLVKAYGTSPSGPKRVLYLLVVEDDEELFPLFYRYKNNPVGRNAAMSNSGFRSALKKHLALLEKDILSANIQELRFLNQP